MKISLIALGKRLPDWVNNGVAEYAGRLTGEISLSVVEIPLPKRAKSVSIAQLLAQEGQAMLAAIAKGDWVVALDLRGRAFSTEQFAKQLSNWRDDGRDLSLLVGGPDGLAPGCLQRADLHWSLSSLTLPHPLARIVVAEQIYRAVSILRNHPYHRG